MDEAIEHLKSASQSKLFSSSSLREDFTEEKGDLYAIAHHPEYRRDVEGIVLAFEAAVKA